MRQNEMRKKLEDETEKIPSRTTGGPHLPSREEVIEKFKNKQKLVKLELTKQIDMEQNGRKLNKEIEGQQDKVQQDENTALYIQEKLARQQALHEQKEHMAKIWAAQKKIKQENDEVEAAF